MKNLRKLVMMVSWVLFLGIFFIGIGFGENTATFSASCFVPSFAAISNEQASMNEGQNKSLIESKEMEKSSNYGDNQNLIQQEEEIISEDNSQIELITTVCAK